MKYNGKDVALVAEDNPPIRMLIEDTLEEYGIKVHTYPNGEKLCNEVDRRRQSGEGYGLVLTDRKMPVMGGEEVIRRIREHDTKTPIYLVTGTPLREGELRELPVDGQVEKPITPGKLREVLQNEGLGSV